MTRGQTLIRRHLHYTRETGLQGTLHLETSTNQTHNHCFPNSNMKPYLNSKMSWLSFGLVFVVQKPSGARHCNCVNVYVHRELTSVPKRGFGTFDIVYILVSSLVAHNYRTTHELMNDCMRSIQHTRDLTREELRLLPFNLKAVGANEVHRHG